MKRALLCALGAALITATPSIAQPEPPPTVALARIVSSIPRNAVWAKLERHLTDCWPDIRELEWTGPTGDVDIKPFTSAVADALQTAGFKPADDPGNLFQKERGASDLAIAGNIKGISASLCAADESSASAPRSIPRYEERRGSFLNLDAATGKVSFSVEWQVYSRSRDRIIDKETVNSTFTIDKHARGNLSKFFQLGMEGNIRAYIGSSDFKAAVMAAATPDTFAPASQSKLVLTGAHTAGVGKISDAVGSVVLIQSAGGHGSGFLVSSDGYVMTARHVIGPDKYVKIRWSDGLEGVGEVVRSDTRRDVAILKVDPRGRQPLSLHLTVPAPGDTVFAIGAPIDPKLQGTVTRGVASSNRIIDGFAFIQSDVTVDPGNSGGPLLNEKGEVLGFTDIGLRTAEAPTGLNFFVPIDDALRFLSVDPG